MLSPPKPTDCLQGPAEPPGLPGERGSSLLQKDYKCIDPIYHKLLLISDIV